MANKGISLVSVSVDGIIVAVYQRLLGGAWAIAVVFSTNAAATNSAGNVARSNEQYLPFIAEVCVGFSAGNERGRFLLANAPSIFPRMSRRPGRAKKKIQ